MLRFKEIGDAYIVGVNRFGTGQKYSLHNRNKYSKIDTQEIPVSKNPPTPKNIHSAADSTLTKVHFALFSPAPLMAYEPPTKESITKIERWPDGRNAFRVLSPDQVRCAYKSGFLGVRTPLNPESVFLMDASGDEKFGLEYTNEGKIWALPTKPEHKKHASELAKYVIQNMTEIAENCGYQAADKLLEAFLAQFTRANGTRNNFLESDTLHSEYTLNALHFLAGEVTAKANIVTVFPRPGRLPERFEV